MSTLMSPLAWDAVALAGDAVALAALAASGALLVAGALAVLAAAGVLLVCAGLLLGACSQAVRMNALASRAGMIWGFMGCPFGWVLG